MGIYLRCSSLKVRNTSWTSLTFSGRTVLPMQGHRFAAKIPYNVQHSKKKKKKTRSQSRYQTTGGNRTVIYVVGIDDLLIKYKYALFIILKANLIKIPKIT